MVPSASLSDRLRTARRSVRQPRASSVSMLALVLFLAFSAEIVWLQCESSRRRMADSGAASRLVL